MFFKNIFYIVCGTFHLQFYFKKIPGKLVSIWVDKTNDLIGQRLHQAVSMAQDGTEWHNTRTDYGRNSPIIRTCLLYNRLECDTDVFNDSFPYFINALQLVHLDHDVCILFYVKKLINYLMIFIL